MLRYCFDMKNTNAVKFLDRRSPPHLLTLVLLAGISAMSMSIFLPSLPAMTMEFGTSYGVMQLSVSLYLAFTAASQILIGPISDKFGRRPAILGALGLFTLASIGCMLSTNAETFLFFRMVQSVVAVSMVLSRAIIRDIVPQAESAAMIGYVTMGMSLVPMVAPSIGGVLDAGFGWRATFLVMAVFGSALMVLCYFDQGETNLSKGQSFTAQISEYPELFTSPRFWGYSLSAAFSSGAFFAFLGGAPYIATTIYDQPAATVGMFLGIPAIGYFFGNLFSGRLSVRLGINRMIWIGSVVLLFGMSCSILVTWIGFGSLASFFTFCAFVGLGNGMVLPNATAGLLSVRPHLAGTASGVGGAIMIGGGAALAAVAGAVLEGSTTSLPLQWIMLLSALACVFAISFVSWREAQIA